MRRDGGVREEAEGFGMYGTYDERGKDGEGGRKRGGASE